MLFSVKQSVLKVIVTTLALSSLNPASAAAVSNSGLATNNLVNSTTDLHNNARILGGEPAKIEEFPYMGGIVVRFGEYNIFRSGSLISDKFVVTMSDFLYFEDSELDAGDISVTLGTDMNSYEADVQSYSVKNYYFHPEYSTSISKQLVSIALIELSQPVPKDVATPATIYSGKVTDDMMLTTAGWELTSPGGKFELSRTLNKITISPSSSKDCELEVGLWTGNDGPIICTVVKDNKSVYYRDSGGPLVYTANGANLLVGLVIGETRPDNSTDIEPGENGSLNYFIRLYNYVDWIANVTGIDKSILLDEKQSVPSGNSTNDKSTNPQDSSSSTMNSSSSISSSFLSKPITPLLLAIPLLVLSLL
ncbi:Clotting factor B [Zancudomyces culisetae]|uniref:Clotting factor B n=1 Tax=Zancudomyces culisetae TaxID=1213189 RepID=A0A1R1PR21_ZANCU|nr:Clotting factor B [Zancudomyces culisetae]|eukprot:OMH83398.1 Clotting factor B [Zancudomyces culisetae]